MNRTLQWSSGLYPTAFSSALDKTGTVNIACDDIDVNNNEGEQLALLVQQEMDPGTR